MAKKKGEAPAQGITRGYGGRTSMKGAEQHGGEVPTIEKAGTQKRYTSTNYGGKTSVPKDTTVKENTSRVGVVNQRGYKGGLDYPTAEPRRTKDGVGNKKLDL